MTITSVTSTAVMTRTTLKKSILMGKKKNTRYCNFIGSKISKSLNNHMTKIRNSIGLYV